MTVSRSTSLLCLALLAASVAGAQGPTPPSPPPAPPTPPAPIVRYDRGRVMEMQDREKFTMDRGSGGSMGIVPPGTWWKNPDTITALSLSTEQQKKMDDILRQNRIALIDLKASLDKEQINLEPLLNANPVDSAKALLEISKIADLRAGLEKANAKMLLGLRAVLTADQWTKLQDLQHSHRKGPDAGDREGMRGPKGPTPRPGQPTPPPVTN